MINEKDTVGKNMEENDGLVDFLNMQQLSIDKANPILWKVSLGSILRTKQININNFIKEYEDYKSMNSTSLHYTGENKEYTLYGRIPCVVQLPVQENLDEKYPNQNMYNIALAEFGSDWGFCTLY